jgi:hypothetical protein
MSKVITLEDNEISMILGALSQGPYHAVSTLINKISAQSNGGPIGLGTQSDSHPAGNLGSNGHSPARDNLAGPQGQDQVSLKGVTKTLSSAGEDAAVDAASLHKTKNS